MRNVYNSTETPDVTNQDDLDFYIYDPTMDPIVWDIDYRFLGLEMTDLMYEKRKNDVSDDVF